MDEDERKRYVNCCIEESISSSLEEIGERKNAESKALNLHHK